MMCKTDITPRFLLDQIDHHEFLDILTIRYKTCWRVSKREITFPATHDYRLKLRIRHGQVEQVYAGKALTEADLCQLLEQVEADLKDDRIAEYGVEILFAHKPVTGGFRFGAIPMQILPPPAEAPRAPYSAHHPFILEYPMRAYRTPELRLRRRHKNAMEWARVLNASLHGAITTYSSPRPKQMWAINSSDITSAPFWANRAYCFSGHRPLTNELSEQGELLRIVPADAYFGDARTRMQVALPVDAFFVPDNLDLLASAFVNLDSVKRRRFLRSAAAIYSAQELWDVSISSYFLSCVQAIETLARDVGPGSTKLFREFVKKYCLTSGVTDTVLKALYGVRSALAHGEYLFQLDEAPWSSNMASIVASLGEEEIYSAALTVAKTGLRNWLLSQVMVV
jgi:hypothetical protein